MHQLERGLAAAAIACALHLPLLARADGCEDLATPEVLDAASAMRAVFCYYNPAHRGTLRPLRHTARWNLPAAEQLASPHLVATYQEGSVRKGVLVVERQALVDGRIDEAPSTPVTLSVYVFSYDLAERRWELEKGDAAVATGGSCGRAPAARLVRLGDERHGLWLEYGVTDRGDTSSVAYLVDLSEPEVVKSIPPAFDVGASGCAEDGACWAYKGTPEIVRRKGRPEHLLRIRYSGTWQPPGEPIRSRDEAVCFDRQGGAYRPVEAARCADYPALPEREAFSPGQPVVAKDR